MRINADSSGWEQRICQGSVQLYQSVNSHDYDENFGAHCVLLIGFLLWASFPDSGTADAEAIKCLGHGHKSRCILSVGVMSEHAGPVPDWICIIMVGYIGGSVDDYYSITRALISDGSKLRAKNWCCSSFHYSGRGDIKWRSDMERVKHKEWAYVRVCVSVCARRDVHLIHKRLTHILLDVLRTRTHTSPLLLPCL